MSPALDRASFHACCVFFAGLLIAPGVGRCTSEFTWQRPLPVMLAFMLATCVVSVVVGVIGFTWRTRTRKIDDGVCVGCGYDLTGNLSGRCPECGRETLSAPRSRGHGFGDGGGGAVSA